ncbi:MAG: hypothetical protein PHF46_00115 [Candidatus Gracilibacteria bacterium]|nr:hypothetical protein [Candidatus Gracilibacteria bacterium]MDD3119800.1 hypothetical protein [Candidatus Gracilibacteria bacterium]MDD4530181.1 hypothetical protein [Candidatus Gracilibacteria bacterium]
MFKKKITFLIITILLTTGYLQLANANENSKPQYETKIIKDLNFQAELKDGKVYTSWNDKTADFISSDVWKYWKVIRSQEKSNPFYPEDGYIKYDTTKIGFNSYIDENSPLGTNYYRVCAIATGIRYCSDVVKIDNIKKSEEQPEEETKKIEIKAKNPVSITESPKNTNSGELSYKLKEKLDLTLIKFKYKLKKLDSDEQRLKIVTTIKSKLLELESKKPEYKNLIDYLTKEMESLEQQYKGTVPDDITKIFD